MNAATITTRKERPGESAPVGRGHAGADGTDVVRNVARRWRPIRRSRLVIMALIVAGCGSDGLAQQVVSLGAATQYRAGQVVEFPEQGIVLAVESTDSAESFRAFRAIDPWSGCRVHWEASIERFTDPCGGSFWERDGTPAAGPSCHPLVELPIHVRAGVIEVVVSLAHGSHGPVARW
jgi:hypothetical protein